MRGEGCAPPDTRSDWARETERVTVRLAVVYEPVDGRWHVYHASTTKVV